MAFQIWGRGGTFRSWTTPNSDNYATLHWELDELTHLGCGMNGDLGSRNWVLDLEDLDSNLGSAT